MAIDNKYGRVTLEHGSIAETEPVVVFRGQDALLPKVMAYYMMLCMKAATPPHHLLAILAADNTIKDWQEENRTRLPNSNAYVERLADPTSEDRAPDTKTEVILQLEEVLDVLADRAAASRRKGKEADDAGKDHRAAAMRGKAIGLQQGADQINKVISQLRGGEVDL